MTELPATRRGRMEYFEARVDRWASSSAGIGLSVQQTGAMDLATEGCRAAFDAMMVARDAARSATRNFYNRNNTMVALGRGLITTIKAYAETTGGPGVYPLAGVAPPPRPARAPAPEAPTNFVGAVSPEGAVALSWEARASGPNAGVFFLIEKRRGAEGEYAVLGATMERRYADPAADLRRGPVQYRVRAVRGTDESAWSQPIVFNIGRGKGSGGSGAEEMKLAA
jgi:hypothetical protein